MTFVKRWFGFTNPDRLSRVLSLLCLLVLFLVPVEFSYSVNNNCNVQQNLLTMLRSEVELLKQDYRALQTTINSLEGKSASLDAELTTLRQLRTAWDTSYNRIGELSEGITGDVQRISNQVTKSGDRFTRIDTIIDQLASQLGPCECDYKE